MTAAITSAEVFAPGEILRDELDARGWSEVEFAEILGRPTQAISEILNGKKEITPETAVAFGDALGTSAELWLNLQSAYRVHHVRADVPERSAVARRARLRALIPVREAQKCGWLAEAKNLVELEAAVCAFLGMDSPASTPALAVAARRSNSDAPFTPEQLAWVTRVRHVGSAQAVAVFAREKLERLAERLSSQVSDPSDLIHLAAWLAECGVAFVVELPLKAGKIDGVLMFSSAGTPIIGLSTRGDRMDSLLFTMLHEIAHLLSGHVVQGDVQLDEDVLGDDGRAEAEANELAARWILPGKVVVDHKPTLPEIAKIAQSLNVHISVVIGRLQREGVLDWSDFLRSIPKVRPYLKVG